ncbi:helix-turn-helix transcriptional regulator [Streptomyces sp. NBC_00258]|uniref:helix-turn-helix transcriptional regulator n=1 Tax=Streptomyces sp. NBC_00258 TaxID=2903642 RepID=UPI002E2C776B|nr:helix-turn-helix domain-containing protein [Streptomyces sp. NBC_00258]
MSNESAEIGISENAMEGVGLTRREFAKLARVHPDTVKRWARVGIGPQPHKIGPRLVRYDRGEVLEYLNISPAGASA